MLSLLHFSGRTAEDDVIRCLGDSRHVYIVATATLSAVWCRMLESECYVERLHWNVETAD